MADVEDVCLFGCVHARDASSDFFFFFLDAEQKNGKGPDSPPSVPKEKRTEAEIGE